MVFKVSLIFGHQTIGGHRGTFNLTSFLKNLIDRRVINEETLKYLRPQDSRTSRFYILPKIHKERIPGRQIVSSCGAPTEKCLSLWTFIYNHWSLRVHLYKGYYRLPCKLKSVWKRSPGGLLLTLYVSSLYTNILHQKGIHVCRKILDWRDFQEPLTEAIVEVIGLILTNNNFTFNDQQFSQTKGTAMGTQMAPSYSNIFMDDLERRMLASMEETPLTWWRYVDDVFAIWPHSVERLKTFLKSINEFHPLIKFTVEWCSKSV